MQHCSKIECTTISSHPTLPISNKCFNSMVIYSIYLDKSYRGTVLSCLSHLYMGALHRALPSSRIFHLFSSHLHRSQSKLQLSIRSIRNLLKGKCLVHKIVREHAKLKVKVDNIDRFYYQGIPEHYSFPEFQ